MTTVSFKAQKQLCGTVNLTPNWSSLMINHQHTHTHIPALRDSTERPIQNTHRYTHSTVASPFYLWLIVQPEDEVGEQLEQVLPQQHGHVKVNVAYVRLAQVSGVAHVAHAHKSVDEVAAVASVQTGVGLALVHLLLTPAHTESHLGQARCSQSTPD